MQNVLLRPGLERKSFERGAIVPLGRAPETKDVKDDDTLNVSPDTKKLFMMLANELKAVRDKNDSRHDDLKDQIDKKLIEAKRPIVKGENPPETLSKEWKNYLRHGITHGLEEKALSEGSGPDGGYVAPTTLSNRIIAVARNRSNIRQIAQSVEITSGMWEVAIDPNDLDAAWVSETASRPETQTPQLVKLSFPVHEMYAMPRATQTILDDNAVNIEQWLADRVADRLSRLENTAFVLGDGVGKPRGFMNQTFVANASWSFGSVGYIPSGFATGFLAANAVTAVNPVDALYNLTYALKAEYRENARWVMNSNTAGALRKLKDAQARNLWTDSLIAGQPAFLAGYAVTIAEDMPDVGTDTFPIAFGDFSRAYVVVDRIGVRILRDPYSAKPYVSFYTTKRVGGGVADYDAYKVLKVAAT